MNEFVRELIRVGLSENEAKVYAALLQLGTGTVHQIALRSGVHRATTYGVLNALVLEGLMVMEKRGAERWYVAEAPERLVTRLKVQHEEIEERTRIAQRVMPRLRALYQRDSTRPKIRYHESITGLRAMQKEFETHATDIIQLVGYDAFLALYEPAVSKEHLGELEKRQVRIRAMLVTDQLLHVPVREGAEVILVPTSVARISGEMTVADDVLALFSYDNGMMAIEIASKPIADTARAALELAWNEAKRVTK